MSFGFFVANEIGALTATQTGFTYRVMCFLGVTIVFNVLKIIQESEERHHLLYAVGKYFLKSFFVKKKKTK